MESPVEFIHSLLQNSTHSTGLGCRYLQIVQVDFTEVILNKNFDICKCLLSCEQTLPILDELVKKDV